MNVLDHAVGLRELVAVNRAITSSLDYDDVVLMVVEKTAAFLAAQSCLLLLAHEDGRARVVASVGVEPEAAARFAHPLDERILDALRAQLCLEPSDLLLGAPVVQRGQVRGILAVSTGASPPQCTQEDLLLSGLADQAALALDHAARFETALSGQAESEQWLGAALDSGETGVWNWDIEQDRVEWSDRVYEFHGLRRGAFGGTAEHFVALVHQEDREGVSEALRRAVSERSPYRLEFRVVRPDGEIRWLYTAARVVLDAAGRPVRILGATQDVSERKQLEAELRETVAALQEADRRKDEFLAMLGHELRNPLAAIANASHSLAQMPPADPRARAVQGRIARQTRHMTRMVDDLLDVSRLRGRTIELRREPIQLSVLLRRAEETVQSMLIGQEHELSVELPQTPVWLEADPVRLEQVLVNLLTNAVRYTPSGGRIWLTGAVEGGRAVIRVRDTGVGLAPEHRPRLFELFSQIHGVGEPNRGLGVGLFLVKQLVELHGGVVTADSPGLGQGSTFAISLPAVPHPPVLGALRRTAEPARERRRRILVVEDNRDAAESLVEVLEFWGHTVHHAPDGVEALRLARLFEPEVVLLDLGLPGMDGYEVARRLRAEERLRALLVVAVSGYSEEEGRRLGRETCFDHHLTKPVDLETVRGLIDSPPDGRPAAWPGPQSSPADEIEVIHTTV
jgi:PAS domain S-box-containing protein